jgi:hypothetical protein
VQGVRPQARPETGSEYHSLHKMCNSPFIFKLCGAYQLRYPPVSSPYRAFNKGRRFPGSKIAPNLPHPGTPGIVGRGPPLRAAVPRAGYQTSTERPGSDQKP